MRGMGLRLSVTLLTVIPWHGPDAAGRGQYGPGG